MARRQSGAAMPIIISTRRQLGRRAMPVVVVDSDSRVISGAAQPIVEVDDAYVAANGLSSDTPVPVVVQTGDRTKGGRALPVYVVSGSISPSTPVEPVIPANLEALYLFENDWTDSSDNSNALTPVNAPAFDCADAQEGSCSADFEASSSQNSFITDATQTGLDITGSLSIGGWVKFETAPGAGQFAVLIAKWDEGTPDRAYTLYYSGNLGKIVFAVSDNGVNEDIVTSDTTPAVGEWQHWVAVYDGVDLRIYKDGVLDCTPIAYADGIRSNSAPFSVGAMDNGGSWILHLDGKLDEVFVFSKALTPAEISNIYNNGVL